MKCHRTLLFTAQCALLTVLSAWMGSGLSQDAAPEINDKASRYLRALERRPESDTLFSRFFDAWLETGTLSGLETFLTEKSTDGPGRLLLSIYYLRQGKDESAVKWLEEIVSDESSTAQLRVTARTSLGKISAKNLSFDTALQHLEAAKAEVDGFAKPDRKQEDEISKLLGRIHIRSGDPEQGIKIWKGILDRYPDDQILQEDVIELLSDEGFYDEAIERQIALLEGAKDAHQKVANQIHLGKIYRKASRDDKAVEIWKKALPVTGNDTWMEREILALIEASFRRKSDIKGWRSLLDQMIAEEPNRIALNLVQANLLAELREDEAALDAWIKILKLTPGDRELRLQFVRTLARLDRPGEAAERMKELIALAPADAELEFELADLYAYSLQLDKAGDSLDAYLKKSDQSEFAYLRTSRQMHRLNLTARAEKVYQEMIGNFPESPGPREAYAKFLYETERKNQAIALWKELAAEGDRRQLLNVSRQLSQRFENKAAFEVLQSRLTEFEDDETVLGEICLLALPLKMADEVFHLARHRVDLATSPTDLNSAIALALKVAIRSGDIRGEIDKIASDASATLGSRCLAAMMQNHLEGIDAAIETLENLATSASPEDSLYPLISIAQLQKSEQWWMDAARTMERVVEAPGGRKSSNIQELVELFGRALDTTSTLKWTREWKKIAPGNPRPWMREAEALNYRGLIDESLEVLRDAARRFESSSEIRIRLARAYSMAGYPAEAERSLWKLYEEAEDQWARRGWIDELARLARENGRLEQLIDVFKERQRNNSKSAGPLLALAQVYQFADRKEDYRETLLAASRLEPDNLLLIQRVATLDEQEGRFESAIQLMEKALPRDKTGRITEKLAQLHLNSGNVSRALALMEEMPSGRKVSPDELIKMAQTIAMIGEWDVLSDYLAPKLADHPDDPRIHHLHAVSLYLADHREKAKAALLKLLSFEGEVTPSNQPAVVPAANLDYPPEVAQLTQFMGHVVQMKRIATGWGTPGAVYSLAANSNYGNQYVINLPSKSDQIQAYAAGLLSLMPKSEELDREMLAAGLSRRQLAVLSGDIKQTQDFKKMLEHRPDDAALHYWAISGHPALSDEGPVLARAIDLVKQEYGADEAASLLFLTLGKPGEDDRKELVSKGAALLSTVDSVSDSLAIHLGRYMLSALGEKEKVALPEEWPELHKTLARWTPQNDGKNPMGNSGAFETVMAVLARDGMRDEWLKRLETELERYASLDIDPGLTPPAQDLINIRRNIYFGSMHRRAPELPEIPRFSTHYPGFSPLVQKVLTSATVNHPNLGVMLGFQASGNLHFTASAKPEGLSEVLHEYEDRPFLGVLLARAVSDHEIGREMIERLRGKPLGDLSPAERLFLAHEDYHEGKLDSSLEHFLAVRGAPLDSILAKSIDLAIIYLTRDSVEDSEARDLAIKAATRLRSSKVLDANSEWPAVSEVLKGWGRNALAKAPPAKGSTPVVMYHFNQGSVRSGLQIADLRGLYNRVRQYIADGNADAAVRTCSKQLPLISGYILSPRGEYQKQQFSSIVSQLETKDGMIDQIIEATRPDGGRRLDKARFAAVCDILGDWGEAMTIYRELLEEKPTDTTIRLRVMHLLAATDPVKAIDELKLIAEGGAGDSFLSEALSAMAEARMPIEAKLDSAEVLLGFGKSQNEDGPSHNWMMNLASRLEEYISDPDSPSGAKPNPAFRMPSIYDINFENSNYRPKSAGENQKRFDRIYQRRLEVYVKLCRSGIEIPGLSPQFFERLVRLKAVEKAMLKSETFRQILPGGELISQAELFELCKLSLQHLPTGNTSYFGNLQAPSYTYKNGVRVYTDPDDPAPQSTAAYPVTWLVEYALRNNVQGTVEECTGYIRKDNPVLANHMVALGDLYFCKADEFADELEDFGLNNPASRTYQWRLIQRILALRPEIEAQFDPDKLIMDAAKNYPDHSLKDYAIFRARAIGAEKAREDVAGFVNEFTTALIGSGEERANFLTTQISNWSQVYYSSVGQIGVSDGNRFRVLTDFLREFSAFPEGAFVAAKLSREMGLSQKEEFRNYWRIFSGGNNFTPDMLPVLVSNSPLLEDVEHYEFYPVSDFKNFSNQGQDLLVGSILNEIREDYQSSSKADDRKKLAESFTGETFGSQLLRAVLSESSDGDILRVFDKHIVTLQDLPDDRKKLFGLLAARLIRPQNLPADLTRDEYDTVRWIGRVSGEGEASKMDKLIEAKTIADTGVKPDRFYYTLKEQIAMAMRFEWEKAFEAFINIASIGEDALRTRKIRPPNSSEPNFTDPMLRDLLRVSSPVNGYAFVNQMFHRDGMPTLYMALPDFDDSLVRSIREAKTDQDKVKVVSTFADRIYADLPAGGDTALAIPIFYQMFRSSSTGFLPELREWAQGRNGIALMPDLARDIDIAASIRLRDKSEIANPESPIYQRLKKTLTDQNINPGLRFLVAGMICDDYSIHTDEIIQLSANALRDAWQKTGAVNVYQARDIINALEYRYQKMGREKWLESDWAEMDKALGEAFHRQYVTGTSKCGYSDLITKMMHLQLRREALPMANELYRKYDAELRYPLSIFIEMVRFGQFQTAGQILRTKTSELFSNTSTSQRFDPALAGQVKPFLDTLGNDPKQLWLAEYLLTQISDPGSDSPFPSGWADREGRRLEVAKKFQPTIFTDPVERDRALAGMVDDPKVVAVLEPVLRDVNNDRDLNSISNQKDYSNRNHQLKLYNTVLLLDLEDGVVDSTLAALKDYDELSNQIQSNNRTVLEVPGTATRRFGSDPEKSQMLCDLWLEVAKRKTYRINYSVSYQDLGMIVACHLRGGKESELDAFFGKLSSDTRNTFSDTLKNRTSNVRSYIESPLNAMPSKDRDALIRKFEDLDLPSLNLKSIAAERIAGFLGAKTAAATGFSSSSFEDEVSKIMLSTKTLSDRRAVYDHAIALVKEVQKSKNGWGKSYDNGHSYAAEQIREFSSDATGGTWDAAVMICEVLWNDTPENFTFTWSNIYYQVTNFRTMWNEARRGTDADVAFAEIFENLERALPETDSTRDYSVLFPIFFEFCSGIDKHGEVVLAINAADKMGGPLAEQFSAAGRLWLDSRPKLNASPGDLELGDWVEHIEKVFDAPETLDQMKMTLARHCLFRAHRKCPDSLRKLLTFEAAQLLDKETPVNGWELALLLKEFNQLPRDKEWDAHARLYIKGWNHKNRNNHLSKERGIAFHPVDDAKLAMLETHLMLGDSELLEAFLKVYEPAIEKRSRALVLLVRHGEFDRANDWVNRNYLEYSTDDHSTNRGAYDLRYNLETHRKVTEFLEMLPMTEKRYLAAYALVSTPDPDPELRPPNEVLRPTARRMQDISDTYRRTTFTTGKAKRKAVLYSGARWQAAGKLYKELGALFRSTDIEAIPATTSSTAIDKKLQPLASYAVASLVKADSKPFVELVNRIGGAPVSKRRTYRVHSLRLCGRELVSISHSRVVNGKPEQVAAISEAIDAILASIDLATIETTWSELMTFQITLAGLQKEDGGLDRLAKWRSDLDEKEKTSLIKVLEERRDQTTQRIASVLKIGTPNEVEPEVRWSVISTFLTDPWFRESWSNHPDEPVMKFILETGALPAEEVQTRKGELVNFWPRDGKSEQEIDAWLRKQKP